MRRSRTLPVAVTAALLVSGGAVASAADPSPVQPAGSSASVLTLLTLSAADQELRAGVLELLASTLTAPPTAGATVTPLLAGGRAYGRQSVTAGGAPLSVPAQDSAALVPALAGLVSAATPAFTASATTTAASATSSVGATDLGQVRLLGLPLALDGALGAVSTVTGSGSTGEQVVEVTDLALPSVADLLAALGVDLSALPVEILYELLDQLDLVPATVEGLKGELDAALAPLQAQVDAAQAAIAVAEAGLLAEQATLAPATAALADAEADLAAATAALAPLQAELTSAQLELTAAREDLADASGALTAALASLGVTLEQYLASPLLQATAGDLIDPLIQAVDDAQAAVDAATAAAQQAAADLAAAQSVEDAARAAVTAAQAAVAVVQGLIDSAQQLLDDALAALDSLLQAVLPRIEALLGAVTAVLDGTPLVSLSALSVVTRTSVTSAAPGGQSAEVVGGEVTGLRVLGTDVLADVLGTTSVELLDLTTAELGAVNGVVDTLTGTLSSVLSSVPGFPSLSVPAPQVELLRETTDTGVVDGFGTASAGVDLLSVGLPAITLPLGLQLPRAAGLPAFADLTGTVSAAAVGDLVSTPVSLSVASLGPQSRFRPGTLTAAPVTGPPTTGTPTSGTPTTGTPTVAAPAPRRSLPRTGTPELVAVAGLALLGTAALLRRRRAEPSDART